jgi:DNA-binding transcriptional LysR family regulator
VTVPAARGPQRRPIALAALRGFDASARHLSFTQAAEALSLTQSSISRQVAALERQVGRALFVRRTRALELTAAGERLHRSVRTALQSVDRVVDELRGIDQPPRLSLTTYASFASLWLVPRLAAFQRAYPDLEIRIDAADRFIDLEEESVDFAVRWMRPERAPHTAVKLLEEEITPAVSPRLLERTGVRLDAPEALYRLPLLEMDDGLPTAAAGSWARWFAFAGIAPRRAAGQVMFTFIDQTMQAAVRGHGVVLARRPFIEDVVAAGDLLTPFPDLWMRTGYAYFQVENRQRAHLPQVAAFRAWLTGAFRAGPAPPSPEARDRPRR